MCSVHGNGDQCAQMTFLGFISQLVMSSNFIGTYYCMAQSLFPMTRFYLINLNIITPLLDCPYVASLINIAAKKIALNILISLLPKIQKVANLA